MTTENEFVEMLDKLHDVLVTRYRVAVDVEEALTAAEDRLKLVESRLTLIEQNWE